MVSYFFRKWKLFKHRKVYANLYYQTNKIFFRQVHYQWFIYNLSLWVLGLAVSNINESQLQTYESQTLSLMTSLQYYCIPGLTGTRWNKNLCAKDAGCSGNKITALWAFTCPWTSRKFYYFHIPVYILVVKGLSVYPCSITTMQLHRAA